MSTDRHSYAEPRPTEDDPIEWARKEVANGVRQFDLMLDFIRDQLRSTDAFRLRPRTILALQEAALHDIHPQAGQYRNTIIHISGSKHAPPSFLDVPEHVAALCTYVNVNWEGRSAVHLAAYVLWRLNWIHAFADGNGRTARAVAYYVLCARLQSLLPGTPTIPEQIAANKGPYYDALEAADAASSEDHVDVSAMEKMLEEMLVRQLVGRPALPDGARYKLLEIISNRIRKAPTELLQKAYGTAQVDDQLWHLGDQLILQISTKAGIAEAETRRATFDNPFPRLLAIGDAHGTKTIAETHVGTVIGHETIDASHDYVLALERGAAATLCDVTINWRTPSSDYQQWREAGALYVLRLGRQITFENFPATVDLLIARHLNAARVET